MDDSALGNVTIYLRQQFITGKFEGIFEIFDETNVWPQTLKLNSLE
jgi:hypothetical protein